MTQRRFQARCGPGVGPFPLAAVRAWARSALPCFSDVENIGSRPPPSAARWAEKSYWALRELRPDRFSISRASPRLSSQGIERVLSCLRMNYEWIVHLGSLGCNRVDPKGMGKDFWTREREKRGNVERKDRARIYPIKPCLLSWTRQSSKHAGHLIELPNPPPRRVSGRRGLHRERLLLLLHQGSDRLFHSHRLRQSRPPVEAQTYIWIFQRKHAYRRSPGALPCFFT